MSNISEFLDKLGRYSSWALLISPWILFLICYLLTPNWVLTKNALSDFGSPEFTKYYLIYNVGLVILAIIIWLMSLGCVLFCDKIKYFETLLNTWQIMSNEKLYKLSYFANMICVNHSALIKQGKIKAVNIYGR